MRLVGFTIRMLLVVLKTQEAQQTSVSVVIERALNIRACNSRFGTVVGESALRCSGPPRRWLVLVMGTQSSRERNFYTYGACKYLSPAEFIDNSKRRSHNCRYAKRSVKNIMWYRTRTRALQPRVLYVFRDKHWNSYHCTEVSIQTFVLYEREFANRHDN